MPILIVCPHCRSSAEAAPGASAVLCPACGGALEAAESIELVEAVRVSGEARVFGGGASDAGVQLDDGSTACPVAFGPYRVLGLIGKGGMGLVYHAVHERTREEVAVKTVRVRKRGMLHRIRREIHALARTEHPGLVRVIETGQSEGLPWYAMELLRGQSLHDRLIEARRPSPRSSESDPRRSSGWDTKADFILAFAVPEDEDASAFALADAAPTATGGGGDAQAGVATNDEGGQSTNTPTQILPLESPPEPSESGSEGEFEPVLESEPESAVEDDQDRPPIVPRPPPEPIPEGDLRQFLVLMAGLCESLAYLHGEGIVHRDIKPQNIIIRPDGMPVLLDFGLVSYFGIGGRESLDVGGKVEGTPEYMSPEQIRGEYVDARADLYAIGCILYEGATGRVPFRAGTPGGTLRAHLKVLPPPPSSLNADIPWELDELILHLLAKQAGDRLGYARDIITTLDALGCVEPGPGADRPPRDYLYRPGFVGRGTTLAQFERHVRRALARPGRCIFLRGQSGAGKTRFIMEVARQLDQAGLTVATGECVPILADRFGDDGPSARITPLHPFRPFLQMVADCCLEKGCEEVARLLGPGGGVLAKCEPSLADLPGVSDAPPGPAEEEEEEGSLHSRLIEALGETLTEFGRTSPVVLFLDDLEFADALTLHFLALFHVGVWDAPNVAIVAAFRSEGDDAAIQEYMPVFRDATFVEIGPLEPASLREIVRDMLGSNEVDGRFVAHLARRSGGNPFFVAEFLRAAVAEGVLRRDGSGCWRAWTRQGGTDLALDATTLDEAIGLPDSLHGLVVRRLASLSDDARALLELAAVVGREVDADLLETVQPIGEARTMAALEALLVAQVLDEGRDGCFRFAHDQLREVAYEQIAPDRRRGLHLAVAQTIDAGIVGRDDRARLSSTLAHHWYRSIADRRAEPEAVARALEYLLASIRQAVNSGLPHEAIELGRAAARLLGVDLPELPAEVDYALDLELERTRRLLRSRRPADLINLPPSSDLEVNRAVRLLLTLQPPAFLSNQLGLFALMASKGLTLTLEGGLGPRAASVFAMTALVRRIMLDQPREAIEFADLAVELDRQVGSPQAAEVLFLKGWFVGHWVAPVLDALPSFDRGTKAGHASGDVLYTCYNHVAYLTFLASGGKPLARVIEEADARIARVGRRVIIARFHCVLERQMARALAGLTVGPGSLSDGSFDESRDLSFICRTTNAIQVGFYHVARLKLHYYRREYREALVAASEALAVAGSFAGQPAEVDLVFFRALSLLAANLKGSSDLDAARHHLATLQRWRSHCEANFGHKALLVEAELARVEGREPDALRHLEAARSAEDAGFHQHAALARELAARHLAAIGDDHRPMLRAAIEGYRGWGATTLADCLEAEG